MKNRNGGIRTLLLMISAAFFVVLVIGLVAYFSSRSMEGSGIVLPDETTAAGSESDDHSAHGFVTVTTENAARLVESLHRPAVYHQVFRRYVGAETAAAATVQLWVCNGVTKLVTTEGGQTRHILTDGSRAYLWYADESRRAQSLTLPEGVTIDDLSGVLTYESIVSLSPEEVRAAQYLTVENVPCLYVESLEGETTYRWWVDMKTGLLRKAEGSAEESLIYSLEQTELQLLSAEDTVIQRQMCLPNGTTPFATAE